MVASRCAKAGMGGVFCCNDSTLGSTQGKDRGARKESGSWREIGGRECDQWPGQSEAASEAHAGSWVRVVAQHEPFLKSAHIFGNLVLFALVRPPPAEGGFRRYSCIARGTMAMGSDGSITHCIQLLKAGEGPPPSNSGSAISSDWSGSPAPAPGSAQRAADEEDVALSAFESFYHRAVRGRSPGSTTATTSGNCWSSSPCARPSTS